MVNAIVFQNVLPEGIFLSTFTEKATKQLKEGLQTILGTVTILIGVPYDISVKKAEANSIVNYPTIFDVNLSMICVFSSRLHIKRESVTV
ncbi:hypothetical protein [Heyndrickxia ginsengihumi]|uniref:hypothetical protein n=1 Tax=Heyndrickxia ginsengihumi TaxID=363870 RepID=UPI003D21BFBA